MPWARPALWLDRVPSSRSMGPTKASKKSRNSASLRLKTSRISSCTSVPKMIGRRPLSAPAAWILRKASSALSMLETNGKVAALISRPSNCVRRLCPMVSAVTPVWSDTKNTALAVTFPLPCRG